MSCDPFLDGCISKIPPEGACARAHNAANLIVEFSMQILAPFFCPGVGCNEGLTGLVSHGPPAVDQCNMVAAWVSNQTFIGNANSRGEIRMIEGGMVYRPTISAQLFLGAYPEMTETAEGLLFYPNVAVLDQASRLMAIIGETWYCGVIQAISETEFMQNNWAVSRCFPLEPQGGCVGWQFEMTVSF